MGSFSKVNEVYGSFFEAGKYPSRICYAVASLPKGSLIEIDCIAVAEERIRGETPEKKVKKD